MHIKARMRGIHKVLDKFYSSNLVMLEKDLQKLYDEVLAQEEILWFKKSRDNWVELDNKNTIFFHTQTVIKRSRRRNKITSLMIKDTQCDDDSVL